MPPRNNCLASASSYSYRYFYRATAQAGLDDLFLTPVHFEWPLCAPTEQTVAGRLPGPVSFLFAYAWVPVLVAKTFLHSPFKLCTRVRGGGGGGGGLVVCGFSGGSAWRLQT